MTNGIALCEDSTPYWQAATIKTIDDPDDYEIRIHWYWQLL